MRVVELSNHPGDMLGDAARRRRAAERRVLSVYEAELIRYRARVQAVRVRRDRARAGRRWWSWLRLSLTVWREKRGIPRPPVPAAGHPTDLESKIMAGIAGEQLVATELGRALDDDWTLLRGYRNRRGEIDQLLIGPRGLFAIEVKNLNATVHVDGDRWRADKYDNYGNLVEQRPIADRMGRSSRSIDGPIAPTTAIEAAESAVSANHASAPNRKIQYNVAPKNANPKTSPRRAPRPGRDPRSDQSSGIIATNASGHTSAGGKASERSSPPATLRASAAGNGTGDGPLRRNRDRASCVCPRAGSDVSPGSSSCT